MLSIHYPKKVRLNSLNFVMYFGKCRLQKCNLIIFVLQSGRSRGFCFVYFESYEDAKVAKEQCTGMEIDGRRIRVDYSITQRAHTPTPGIYMGKPT